MCGRTWGVVFLAAASSFGAEPARVAAVAAGQLKEARASWWGFDREDSTRFLQAAVDSRVPRLIVDAAGAAWVTEGIRLASDQEIVFERGVEVVAKAGSFRGKGDSLFTLAGLTNVVLRGPGAVLRMRRSDYDAPPYAKAEWRHVLCVKSCVNVVVEGLTLAESGGDGIYLGCLRAEWPNRDIVIRGVTCDRNYRQGISVISAENLLIEDTALRGTAGTAPEAGIDFEPNAAGERLSGCVMRNCVSEDNRGSGFDFYLPNLTKASEPVAIRLENCRASGNRAGVKLTTGNADEAAVRGAMSFVDCRFEGGREPGVTISRKPACGLALTFERCALLGCGGTNLAADVTLVSRAEDESPVGGIRMEALRIEQPVSRPWIAWRGNASICEPVAALSGRAVVVCAGERRDVELTPEWVASNLAPRFTIRVPRVKGDLASVRVTRGPSGMLPLSPLRVRHAARYVLHAGRGEEVRLVCAQTRVGRYGADAKPLSVRDATGRTIVNASLPGFGERADVVFLAGEAGFYTLDVDVGANAFLLEKANVPVALDAVSQSVGVIASTGSVYVPVPEGVRVFAFGVAGEGLGESVGVSVVGPSGREVWSNAAVSLAERFVAQEPVSAGLWELRVGKPAQGGFEDFHLEALGVPGYLFLRADRYWQ